MSDQAFPSTSNVFSADDLISKCCALDGGEVAKGTAAVITQTLGFQDGLIQKDIKVKGFVGTASPIWLVRLRLR